MTENQSIPWLELLKQPGLSGKNIADEDVYRAACIGAVMLLYESGNTDALADAVLHASPLKAGDARCGLSKTSPERPAKSKIKRSGSFTFSPS